MNFLIEDYDKNTVMHCPEEWMAREFLNFLESKGRCWCNGVKYSKETQYRRYKDKTAYRFNTGQFGSLDYYESHGYKVLRFEDFFIGENEEFSVEKEDTECINTFLNNFALN